MKAAMVPSPIVLDTTPELSTVEKLICAFARHLPAGTAFEFSLPGRPLRRAGEGSVKFRVSLHNKKAVQALKSLDEMRIGQAYLFGDLSIDGDLVAAFDVRNTFTDRHPLAFLWSIYGQKLFRGQVASDARWIQEHYDVEPEFYLTFLDKKARCYSHAYFASDDEPLESAVQRKLNTAMDACALRPGSRVLDIGAGWGAFTEHAGMRGVHVTSLTISKESERYVSDLIARESLPCRVVREHFLEHKSEEPYDAIVNLGVTEHLPDYTATLKQYQRLLKPGGRVFLDACATAKKHSFSTFVSTYIWPGNTTPLVLAEYLGELAKTPLELISLQNDRHNYLLTTRHWAMNLDRARDEIVQRFGEVLYRRFRLYLWGCVHQFSTHEVTAYRMLLQLPANIAAHRKAARRTGWFRLHAKAEG
ncbi:MAG TPA: class I SAM-dependent methyltransferase [Candidatus Angelobacter sp.]